MDETLVAPTVLMVHLILLQKRNYKKRWEIQL